MRFDQCLQQSRQMFSSPWKFPSNPILLIPSHLGQPLFWFVLSRLCLFLNFRAEWTEFVCVSGFFLLLILEILSCCLFSSVAQSCLTLCSPMDCSTPGLPVHHQLPELAQTHVHWVGDAIQPPHPLSSPSPPVFNLSQHRGLF